MKPTYGIHFVLNEEDKNKLEEAKKNGWVQVDVFRVGLEFCSANKPAQTDYQN